MYCKTFRRDGEHIPGISIAVVGRSGKSHFQLIKSIWQHVNIHSNDKVRAVHLIEHSKHYAVNCETAELHSINRVVPPLLASRRLLVWSFRSIQRFSFWTDIPYYIQTIERLLSHRDILEMTSLPNSWDHIYKKQEHLLILQSQLSFQQYEFVLLKSSIANPIHFVFTP